MLEAAGLGKPRGPGATVPRSRWHAGETNDPHLVCVDDGERLLRQRQEVGNLEVPANFTGGRLRSSDQRQGRRVAHTSEGIPKDSQCLLNPPSETAGGSYFCGREQRHGHAPGAVPRIVGAGLVPALRAWPSAPGSGPFAWPRTWPCPRPRGSHLRLRSPRPSPPSRHPH